MRMLLFFLAMLVMGLGSPGRCAGADGKVADEESLRNFLVGEYDVIGRRPDSGKTYAGKATLRLEGEKLLVTRTIEGKTEKGTVKFDTVAGGDRIPVLRMRFKFEGEEYEATYRWQSDPDNYARLTGLVYRPDQRTKTPGLEAFFPRQK